MMQSCASEEYRAEYAAAPSHFHAFVHIALRWHLQRGGRMTGYLVQPLELKRCDVDVSLRRMPVAPPAHCHYFDERTAVVPTLVKRRRLLPAAREAHACERCVLQFCARGLVVCGQVRTR